MRDLRSPLDGIRSPFGVARGWTPAALFGAGDAGTWLEPSADGTIYRDTAGTDAPTAGETVSRLLDRKDGNLSSLGSDIAVDGDFSSNTGWTLGTGWTISGGSLNYDGTDAPNTAHAAAMTLGAGKLYQVTFDLTISQGIVIVRPQYNILTGQEQFVTGGAISLLVEGQGGAFGFVAGNAGGRFTGSIDNLTCREVPGLHAEQLTAAQRPTFRTSPAHLEDDGVDDNMTWPAPAGTYTVARVNSSGTVTIQTSQSLSGATDMMVETTVAGYVAIDRALTAGETAQLTAYLEGLV
jgi:hypothetical protein